MWHGCYNRMQLSLQPADTNTALCAHSVKPACVQVTLGKTKRHELHDKTAESPADNKNYDRNVFQETTENKRMFKILKTEF